MVICFSWEIYMIHTVISPERCCTASCGLIRMLYWGHSKHKSPMITNPNNKWAEHNWFLCDHYLYLPFAIGGGYIISANPIHKITITSDYLQLYNSEDISVSVWLSAYKIERKDGEHFRTAVQNDYNCAGHACFLLTIKICTDYIIMHSQWPKLLLCCEAIPQCTWTSVYKCTTVIAY